MANLNKDALDQIFVEARTRNGWQDKAVPQALLHEIYDIAKMGPTSLNMQPQRIVFVTSAAAKEKLKPALAEGNLAKTMKAPVVAIFAYDTKFFDLLAQVIPHVPNARAWFADAPDVEWTAFRNATLQAAYFMIAARAKGLDCGPMSGFDNAKLNAAFFPDGRFKSNFICSLGYGTDENLFPRSPRLTFAEACKIA